VETENKIETETNELPAAASEHCPPTHSTCCSQVYVTCHSQLQ